MKKIALCVLLALTAAVCCHSAESKPIERKPMVTLELTYPAGKSPKVFTKGWLFGAKCTVDGKDWSGKVNWSGTASFSPSVGAMSRPAFKAPGANTIVLWVKVGNETVKKTYTVTAISHENYARVGMKVFCPADAHGCPACPHPCTGVIATGSPHVLIDGKPAARVGDKGTHAACCGPNTFEIVSGDPQVLINGKPAARRLDKTKHCGGTGSITEGALAPFQIPQGSFAASITGEVTGKATIKVTGTALTGTFSGVDTGDGSIRHSGRLRASIDAKTGNLTGTLSGASSYVIDKKPYSDPVSGEFQGSISPTGLQCEWRARTSGQYSTKRAGKLTAKITPPQKK